ncbi:MAG: OsmC family protein [Bryobacteraceae bacterium]
MSTTVHEFTIHVHQIENYRFEVEFDKPNHARLALDEPAPLGQDTAPSASRILAAAIGNCLSASLLFCASKARVPIGPIETKVAVEITRNDKGRLRIGKVRVAIDPRVAPELRESAGRCLDLFEDFCTVTQSVRQGIEIDVTVEGMSPASAV